MRRYHAKMVAIIVLNLISVKFTLKTKWYGRSEGTSSLYYCVKFATWCPCTGLFCSTQSAQLWCLVVTFFLHRSFKYATGRRQSPCRQPGFKRVKTYCVKETGLERCYALWERDVHAKARRSAALFACCGFLLQIIHCAPGFCLPTAVDAVCFQQGTGACALRV